MQLKRFTDLGLRILLFLAMRREDGPVSITDLAEKLNWNKNLVVKVTHFMVQQQWLSSIRGRTGGLLLAKSTDQYHLGDLVRQMEGSEVLLDCAHPPCPFGRACSLIPALQDAQEAFFTELNRYTLEDVAKEQKRLSTSVITFRPCCQASA